MVDRQSVFRSAYATSGSNESGCMLSEVELFGYRRADRRRSKSCPGGTQVLSYDYEVSFSVFPLNEIKIAIFHPSLHFADYALLRISICKGKRHTSTHVDDIFHRAI